MSSSFDLHVQTTISPHNGQAYHVETYPVSSDLDRTLESAAQSQKEWIKATLDERIAKGRKFIVCALDNLILAELHYTPSRRNFLLL
jgi:hypothetical protein